MGCQSERSCIGPSQFLEIGHPPAQRLIFPDLTSYVHVALQEVCERDERHRLRA
jgi:hypothetical protein